MHVLRIEGPEACDWRYSSHVEIHLALALVPFLFFISLAWSSRLGGSFIITVMPNPLQVPQIYIQILSYCIISNILVYQNTCRYT